jgi:hypothetical protein
MMDKYQESDHVSRELTHRLVNNELERLHKLGPIVGLGFVIFWGLLITAFVLTIVYMF